MRDAYLQYIDITKQQKTHIFVVYHNFKPLLTATFNPRHPAVFSVYNHPLDQNGHQLIAIWYPKHNYHASKTLQFTIPQKLATKIAHTNLTLPILSKIQPPREHAKPTRSKFTELIIVQNLTMKQRECGTPFAKMPRN
jgi:hypothetical protein